MRVLNTTFFKATAIVVLASTLLAGMISFLNARATQDLALHQLADQARGTTAIVASQLVGAMRFGGGPQIETVLRSVVDDPANAAVGALALDKHGAKLTSYVTAGDDSLLLALGKSALEAGADQQSETGLEVAKVVLSPQNGKVIGVIATGWSDATARAQLNAVQERALMIAAAVLLGVAVVTSLLFRWMMSQPLRRVEDTMGRVAAGELDVAVPAVGRRDEIGSMARALEQFRDKLIAANAITREGLFRGSAFNCASASMLLLDDTLHVKAVNPALLQMMHDHIEDFRAVTSDFDPAQLEGKSFDYFHPKGSPQERALRPENMPMNGEIEIGTGSYRIAVNAITDEDGQTIGYAVEWQNQTEQKRNAGIISALESNQLVVDLDLDANITRANLAFSQYFSGDPDALVGQSVRGKLRFNGTPVCELIKRGETINGTFMFDTPIGTRILEGSANPIPNRKGEPIRFTVLATDRTEETERAERAAEERNIMAAEQRTVVEALRTALAELSDGDIVRQIETPFPGEYESLRLDFNRTKSNLLAAMRTVLENASSIRTEATQITNAAQDMSHRTETQAATLEETAAALNELTASVRSAAEGADRANQMVSDAKTKVETSGNVVKEAVHAMGEIEASSTKISRITSVIDEIAFQTNLLALNAGVEAARAGEAGRGFAVVASEVRALAQRSSEAAREIAQLISSSSSQVKRGVELVGQAGEALSVIQNSVADIFGCVSEIAVSTREQSSGLSEINTAVNQLDQVTQQNAAMFEETSAASQSLLREANGLGEAMGQFRLGTDLQARPAIRSAPRLATSSAPPRQTPAAPTASGPAEHPSPAATPTFSSRRGATAVAVKPAEDADNWEEF
ncbi:MAG: HAMP domain-containing protein [Sphingomonadales bacterium]|nr:HAMP domain-containing protein [Sphingomonadales bacterium]